MGAAPKNRWWGLTAFGCYGVHGGVTLATQPPQNLLWGCHVAALLVGLGWLLRSPRLNGVGLLWEVYGVGLWLLYLATGGELLPTSLATHVGGLLLGLWGARRMGLPKGCWWRATLAMCALMLLTRAVVGPEDNVNVAFAVQAGWEETFPVYSVYVALILSGAATVYLLAERGLGRALRGSSDAGHPQVEQG